MQLSFLDARIRVVDEPSARIEYWPAVVAPAVAQAWFEVLYKEVPWRSDQRLMYDRQVAVPRLRAQYALAGDDVPMTIRDALDAVMRVAPAPYTGVGLNLYRDGRDSVAMHHDRLAELVPGRCGVAVGVGNPMYLRESGLDVEGGGLIFSFFTCLFGAIILLFLVKLVTGRR